MAAVIIDLVLIVLIVASAYRGFKNGIVRGVCGFLALILAIVISNGAASAFSSEFTGALRPFVGGIVDSKVQDILLPDESQPEEPEEVASEDYDISTTYGMAMLTLRRLGFLEPVAEKFTAAIEEETNKIGYSLGEVIADKLSGALAHISVFAVAFILLSIIFAVIGNLLNVVFSLPGLAIVDQTVGMVFGLLKGLIIVLVIAVVFKYFGILGAGLLDETRVLEFFVKHNAIANALGI